MSSGQTLGGSGYAGWILLARQATGIGFISFPAVFCSIQEYGTHVYT